VGKTVLAVKLALTFGGEVINADSRLFYRGFDIGTAKPSVEDRSGVPHHLMDFLDPDESFSLASFLDTARAAVSGITARGRLPILTGGTGQYVWGLVEGWEVPRVPPDPALRRKLEQELAEQGVTALYARLRETNPEAAAAVDARNPRRVMRALERSLAGAEGPALPRKAAEPPFDAFIIGLTLPRRALYERIDRRIDAMVSAGWADEVRRLLSSGTPRAASAMSSIGYREMASQIAGEMTLDEAVAAAKRATRRLVRHQYNWFKLSDPRIYWLEAGGQMVQRAQAAVHGWMLTGRP
jgi:tRNA dimethylallyltransferase